MAKLKINGLHTSAVSNAQGIGEWLQDLLNADIPVTIKCVDGTIGMFDVFDLIEQGKPGSVIFRKLTIYATGAVMDVPGIGGNYQGDPEDVADLWWHYLRSEFPTELETYKHQIWCESTNEVDKNEADWIGWFCYYTGLLALRDGMRWLGPGWSSGEPEYDHWQTPGFLAYLQLCADHPDQLGVSLHEYSYDSDIWNGYPYLIGRFQFLHEICDIHGIAHPTIFFTEWGWEYQTVPHPDEAIPQIIQIGEVYAQYPNVKGVSLWALDVGYGDISNLVQQLMPPLKESLMTTNYPEPVPPPIDPPDDFNDWLIQVAEDNRVFYPNARAAIERQLRLDGYEPYGNEAWRNNDDLNETYAVQGAYLPGSDPVIQRVYYAIIEQFDDVYWIPQGEDTPDPPDPPPTQTIDMLSFMKADPLAWRVVQHPPKPNGEPGPTEDFQDFDYGDDMWCMAKGSNGEWWYASDDHIYLVEDTSPAPDGDGNERFYKVDPGQWCRRFMQTGHTFQDNGHVVQFYSKVDCRPLPENSGESSNNTTVLRLETNYTFNAYGQGLTLDEVLFVQGNTELQIFARHQGRALGRVGWVSDWGSSEIVELYFDRPPLQQPPLRYCV